MKRLIITLTALLAIFVSANAQNLIARQHAGASTFYTSLPAAVASAAAGDTLYIPGGSWESVTINKKLCLIGAGHNPDSTKATGKTIITSVTLAAGADNGSITGAYLSQLLAPSSFSNYTISRCNIDIFSLNASAVTISESIIGQMNLTGTSNALYNSIVINNAIIVPLGALGAYNLIKNNIFLGIKLPLFSHTHCIIENNLFEPNVTAPINDYGGDNFFYNNLMDGNGVSGSNTAVGNFTDVPLSTVFVAYNPLNTVGNNIYKLNFNLPPGSPYKNAGTDGTDLGIYGGPFPWKQGSLPSNPHFQNIDVASQTDASGNLKVQITVAAQGN